MQKMVRLILYITDTKAVDYVQLSVQIGETSSEENLSNLGELHTVSTKKKEKRLRKRRQTSKQVNSSYKNHAPLLQYPQQEKKNDPTQEA